MTDPVIPPEAVKAIRDAIWRVLDTIQDRDYYGMVSPDEDADTITAAVLAALPHLRPPICGDVACPGLGNCEDPDCLPARCEPLLKTATDVALKLGRQEAAEEIAAKAEELIRDMVNPEKPHNQGFAHGCEVMARHARDAAKGTS